MFLCLFISLRLGGAHGWKDLDWYSKELQQRSAAFEALAYLKAAHRILDALPPELVTDVESEMGTDWKAEEQQHAQLQKDEKGIVISAGGPRGALYVPLAYISAYVLRKLGCTWPIELWHDNTRISRWHRGLFKSIGVQLHDLEDVLQNQKLKSPWTADMMKPAYGFAKKLGLFTMIFAVEQTDLDIVTLLNADLIPMVNICQDALWETPDGLDGPTPSALVFPDFHNVSMAEYFPKQWERLGVPLPKSDLPESEGGIVLVNKKACPAGMRTFFNAIRENMRLGVELGEESMSKNFESENPMWRPIWTKAGCYCALGRYPVAIAGANSIPLDGGMRQFFGVGKISRGFKDGRMLGLHYQWGKSMVQFTRPHPAMFPFHPRVEIGTGFAKNSWWNMLAGHGHLGWSSGEWSMSFYCSQTDIPCEERTLHEWFQISEHFQNAWAVAFAFFE